MPPARGRLGPDDSRSEASSTRDRPASLLQNPSNSKGRRMPSSNTTPGAFHRETSSLNPAHAANSNSNGGINSGQDIAGIKWAEMEAPVLNAYRHVYRLDTPAAFSSTLNQMVLSNPSIGRHSPTMARRKNKRRVSKEQLALAVRKNFNGLGVQESEVVVDFLYKVRWQDKNFRMRFAPQRRG